MRQALNDEDILTVTRTDAPSRAALDDDILTSVAVADHSDSDSGGGGA